MKHRQPKNVASLSLVLSLGLVGACTSRQQSIQPEEQKKEDKKSSEGDTKQSADGGPQINDQAAAGQTVKSDEKINGGATPGSGSQEKINGDSNQAATGTATPGTGAAGSDAVTAGGKHAPYKPAPAGYSRTNVDTWVAAHKAKNPTGFRYIYVPAELIADAEKVNILRVAAGKAWNHLSWQQAIDVPEDISDGAGLAFALNAQKVWGAQADTNWGYVAACTPKNIDISPAPVGACEAFPADQPVNIPRFVFNATNGGPYANVHQTPGNFSSFSRTFDMGPVKYVSTHKEAIVCGPRITAYRQLNLKNPPVQLWYSFTSDEFDGRDNGDINYKNQAPTDNDMRSTGAFNAGPGDGNTAIASEWWIQLPNGFMYWGIHGEGSQERGKAEFPFAIDPANWRQNNDLTTGRSCITCHLAGIQSAVSDKDVEGKNGWTSNTELNTFYASVRGKFQDAMKTLVTGLSDGSDDLNTRMVNGTVEVISKAIREIEGGYTGGNDCSFFCNGKYGPQRQNLCETLPTK